MQNSVKEDRYKFIGGSDIPIIMGISPFKTRWQLLLEKAQLAEDTFEGNAYTEYGNTMEGVIRDYINKTYKKNFVEGKHIIEGDPIGIRCHTDGETKDTILEIKTTSEIHETVDEYPVYLCQLLFYMINTNRKKGMLAVYFRPDDFSTEFDPNRLQVFRIKDADYTEHGAEILFYVNKFVDDLKRIIENPLLEEEDFLPPAVVETSRKVVALEEKIADLKTAEAELKKFKADLKRLMTEYEIPSWITPNGTKITLVKDAPSTEEEVTVFDVNKFREDHKTLWKKYSTTEIKTKKGKAGYVRITLPKEGDE